MHLTLTNGDSNRQEIRYLRRVIWPQTYSSKGLTALSLFMS
jgi:hypothetical protein